MKNFCLSCHFGSLKVSFFKLVFHTYVGTGIVHPHLIQNQAQNQRNSQGCILYSTSPYPVPTAVLFWSCSEYWAFSLAVWVGVSVAGLPFVPVDGEDQLLSFVPCKKCNWVLNHTFLLFDPDFVLPLCLLPLGKLLLLPFFLLPWPNNLFGNNQYLSSNKLPDILPAPGHGVSSLTVKGDDAAAASLVGFGGACSKGRHVMVALGLLA